MYSISTISKMAKYGFPSQMILHIVVGLVVCALPFTAHSQPCGSEGYDNGSVVLSDYLENGTCSFTVTNSQSNSNQFMVLQIEQIKLLQTNRESVTISDGLGRVLINVTETTVLPKGISTWDASGRPTLKVELSQRQAAQLSASRRMLAIDSEISVFRGTFKSMKRDDFVGNTKHFSGTNGRIESPGFPSNYPNNFDITYRILTKNAEGKIKLSFKYLDLGPMSKYYEIVDTLRVYDGEVGSNQPPSKEYSSGNIKPDTFYSSSNLVNVRLTTGAEYTGSGFQMQYTEVCIYDGQEMTCEEAHHRDWLGTVITVSVIAAAIGLVGLFALILFCSRRKHTPVYVPLVTNKEGVVGPEETGTAFRDYNTMASAKKDYPHDAV